MINVSFRQTVSMPVKFLKVEAGVRYWEDGTVNGVSDEDGDLIPFKAGDAWKPLIDLERGVIVDWPEGTTASVHYKVCDAGVYSLLDADREEVRKIDGYVPGILSPGGDGYGDYIIMRIDGTGAIEGWSVDLDEFERDEEDAA